MKKIRRTVDLMLTIFKFEEEMYKSEKVNAHFVGHPLMDEIKIPTEAEVKTFRDQYGNKNARFLALLPGSRLQEIKRIFPTMLESVRVLREELASKSVALEAVVGCAPGFDHRVYREIMRKAGVEVHLSDEVDLLMSSADAGMVTSGTATLESALHNLPIVVVYKTSVFTYLIGKLVIKLDSISLVNIVGQQKIVEELVQTDFVPQKAARIIRELLMDSRAADEIRRKYAGLRKILGDPGASDRAAELVLRTI